MKRDINICGIRREELRGSPRRNENYGLFKLVFKKYVQTNISHIFTLYTVNHVGKIISIANLIKHLIVRRRR